MSSAAPAFNGAEADLDAYAAQAAHQLGEAVALMRGYLSLLEPRGQADAELGAVVRGMSAGAERAQRFVDDLLDLAASGRGALAVGPVPLGEAVGAARIRLADDLRDAGADLRSKPLPVVRGDRELIVRLLCHLLRAALAAGATAIDVAGTHEDGLVRVEVRDDGAPVSGDPFAPFARARGRGPLVGAGVGLTVSRRIVELHGGVIAIDASAEGGAVSSFTLPGD
jgi:chemotaxis family two-component system sensor kinase Cph1